MRQLREYILENFKKTVVYLLVGLPGSGKSTWCKQNHKDLPVVSRDIIRAELGYTKNADEKARLEWWQENEVTKKENEQMKEYLSKGQDFIIDDTNLRLKYRSQMIQSLKEEGAYIIGVNFTTPIETCIERRKGQIDEETLRKMESTMNPLQKEEVDKLIEVK